jgi:hypothetical protein
MADSSRLTSVIIITIQSGYVKKVIIALPHHVYRGGKDVIVSSAAQVHQGQALRRLLASGPLVRTSAQRWLSNQIAKHTCTDSDRWLVKVGEDDVGTWKRGWICQALPATFITL